MRKNDSQINFCALESSAITATRVALKLLPGNLGLLFLCCIYPPHCGFSFLAACPFFLLCGEVKRNGKQEMNFLYPPKILLGNNLVWSQQSSVSGSFLKVLLKHMLLRESCGRGTVPPSPTTRSSQLQPKAYWV